MTNTEKLVIALGWNGGTIHDVAEETGMTVDEILTLTYNLPKSYKEREPYRIGQWTTRMGFQKEGMAFARSLAENHDYRDGLKLFWLGVIETHDL